MLCLGNATSSPSTLEFLKSLSPDFQIVKGEFDDNSTLPLSLVITHGSLKIGFTNGYTIVPRGDPLSLLITARQMNVDVLIWGATHKVEAYTLEGKFFVNPGSATGAFTTEWPEIDGVEESQSDVVKEDTTEAYEDSKDEDGSKETTEPSEIAEPENKEEEKEEQSVKKVEDKAIELDKDGSDEEDEDNDIIPSFTLLDIQGSVITLYIYTYINGEVKVDKVSYRKNQ